MYAMQTEAERDTPAMLHRARDDDGKEEFGRALLESAQASIESQTHVDLCENCMTALFNT